MKTASTSHAGSGGVWLVRLKGEILLMAGDAASAEAEFQHVLTPSQRQHAESWALQPATSLARLLIQDARGGKALRVPQQATSSFSEGFATHDLQVANKLVEDLT
jgi:predicted ATPase